MRVDVEVCVCALASTREGWYADRLIIFGRTKLRVGAPRLRDEKEGEEGRTRPVNISTPNFTCMRTSMQPRILL